MGRPSMGGIRMLPDLTPAAVHNLARGMTLKNAAAQLPFGGGKAGIVAGRDLDAHDAHAEVVRRLRPPDLAISGRSTCPGPDVGTNDADMKTVAIENGLDSAVSKPADMGGNRIDQLGAAGGGTHHRPRRPCSRKCLACGRSRCSAGLEVPAPKDVTVLIQGFGAVGAHAARILLERAAFGRSRAGRQRRRRLSVRSGTVCLWMSSSICGRSTAWSPLAFGRPMLDSAAAGSHAKVSTAPERPAARVGLLSHSGRARRQLPRCRRLQRALHDRRPHGAAGPSSSRAPTPTRLIRRGGRRAPGWNAPSTVSVATLIATDYLVNSGGVIFAAQERILKTPPELRIPGGDARGPGPRSRPGSMGIGRRSKALAEQRRVAGEAAREAVIRRNMRELVDAAAADDDRASLPGRRAHQHPPHGRRARAIARPPTF